MAAKNFTLSLPEPLLHRLRIYAAKRNESMTAVINEAIREKVGPADAEYEEARRRALELLANPPDLGTGGTMPLREEFHRRGVR